MADKLQIEDMLDRDFLLFMSVAKTYYSDVRNEEEKTLCMQWLTKLCGKRHCGITQKRNRNIFLSRLVINMLDGKLTNAFLTPPSDKPLPDAKIFFDVPTPKNRSPQEIDNTIQMTDDFQERSADGRTYVAIRCLPKNQGACAFVAVSIDKEDGSFIGDVGSRSVDSTTLNRTRTLHELIELSLDDHSLNAHTQDDYIKNVEATITDNVTKLCECLHSLMLKKGDKHKNEISFYDVLLRQIDDEIRGISVGNHNLIGSLIKRLASDLKKFPMMKRLFMLPPDQQHFKLLQVLRQKLLLRQQEEKKRYLLMEIDSQLREPSATDYPPCSKQPTEYMWQLAVTKPLPDTDIEKLYKIYPKDAILTFVCMVTEDRQAILRMARKRQNTLIDDMRLEIYKEIQSEKIEYYKARATYREWNKILSTFEKIMYESGNQITDDDQTESIDRQDTLVNMIANIKETENLIVQEAHRGEKLIEKILDAKLWSSSILDSDGKDLSWEIKCSIENLKRDIEMYKILIANQEQRIKQLTDELGYT